MVRFLSKSWPWATLGVFCACMAIACGSLGYIRETVNFCISGTAAFVMAWVQRPLGKL